MELLADGNWFTTLFRSPGNVMWVAIALICITPIIVNGIIRWMTINARHRERIEMIRHGMNPDREEVFAVKQ